MNQKEHHRRIWIKTYATNVLFTGYNRKNLEYINRFLTRNNLDPISEAGFLRVIECVRKQMEESKTFILRGTTEFGVFYWDGETWNTASWMAKVFTMPAGDIDEEIKGVFQQKPFPARTIIPVQKDPPHDEVDVLQIDPEAFV